MPNTPPRSLTAPRPYVDIDTTVVMDRALLELADRRFTRRLDAAAQLHLLASLTAQADSWIGEQVTIARSDGATWREIGQLLGTTATAVRQRWTAANRHNTPAPPLAD